MFQIFNGNILFVQQGLGSGCCCYCYYIVPLLEDLLLKIVIEFDCISKEMHPLIRDLHTQSTLLLEQDASNQNKVIRH